MSSKNEVGIPFVSTYDPKGSNAASQSIGKLESQASKLGKTFIAAFSAQKILSFAKDSLKAFAEDDKAAKVLANTMNNLFLGADTAKVEAYIKKLETTTGILDDQLRPAFDTIVRSTKDTGKATDLMNLALDISAGTGKDLASVSNALSKGFLGNTTALGKLGAGLSAADLKSKDFAKIQKKLADLFRGDSAVAAGSFQGSMDRLNATMNNAKETIGKGLVDAFQILAGPDGGIATAQKAVDDFATNFADSLVGLADVSKTVFDFIGKGAKGAFGNVFSDQISQSAAAKIVSTGKWGVLANWGKKVKADKAVTEASNMAGINVAQAQQNILAQKAAIASKTAAADAKTQAALLAKQTKEKANQLLLDKASAVLKQSQKVFDMNAIELAAAAQGKLTDQERARVELKQTQLELQDAIDAKDGALATKLAASVAQEQANIKGVGDAISNIPTAPDAFDSAILNAELYLATLGKINTALGQDSAMPVVPTSVPSYAYSNIGSGYSPTYAGSSYTNAPAAPPEPPNVYVNVDWNQLATNVSSWLQDANAMGTQSATVSRNNNPVINP